MRSGPDGGTVGTVPTATPMLDEVHFPMLTLDPEDVAAAIAWLDELPPSVVLRELEMRTVEAGPFVPPVFVPAAARARGRTELMRRPPGGD